MCYLQGGLSSTTGQSEDDEKSVVHTFPPDIRHRVSGPFHRGVFGFRPIVERFVLMVSVEKRAVITYWIALLDWFPNGSLDRFRLGGNGDIILADKRRLLTNS
jgi:hypothetical protein